MKLLKFMANWCQPCKTLSMQLKEAGIFIQDVDVDTEAAKPLLTKYGIKSIPAIVIDSGSQYTVYVGPLTAERREILKGLTST